MPQLSLEEACTELRNWTKSLSYEVEHCIPHALDALKSTDALPAGCPSRASLALMELSGIDKKLSRSPEWSSNSRTRSGSLGRASDLIAPTGPASRAGVFLFTPKPSTPIADRLP